MRKFYICVRVLFILAVVASYAYFAANSYYTGVCIDEAGAERAVVTLNGVYCYFRFPGEGYAFFKPLRELRQPLQPPIPGSQSG